MTMTINEQIEFLVTERGYSFAEVGAEIGMTGAGVHNSYSKGYENMQLKSVRLLDKLYRKEMSRAKRAEKWAE